MMVKLNGCIFRLKWWLNKKCNDIWNKATDFHHKEIPKTGSTHTCLAVITTNAVLKKDENYFLQKLLKECKYIEKGKR